MTNVKTFENSSMDTLGYIGTSSELQSIGKFSLNQCWCSEELCLGT